MISNLKVKIGSIFLSYSEKVLSTAYSIKNEEMNPKIGHLFFN